MSTATANGPARKSLGEQIDRLDRMLDGLAEGLNDMIVTAVEQAVTAATQAAVAEVLTNPTLQRRLHEGVCLGARPNPLAAAVRCVWAWLRGTAASACRTLAGWVR